jgi:uncharacterized membrane protein YcaP (DUF421 family)
MDVVIRAAAVYMLLILVFRISGKRALAQITTFDFVLLLIISEATQQAMVGSDFSLTGAFLVILTLTVLDIGLSRLKQRSKTVDRLIDSAPLMLIENGRLHKERMEKARIDEDDILSSAREQEGVSRMEEIAYAVLERGGQITVILKEKG